jgi:hypothetical protein
MYNAGVPTNLRSTGGVTVPTHYWMLQGNYENVGNAANADKRNLLPYGNVSFEAIAPIIIFYVYIQKLSHSKATSSWRWRGVVMW